MYTKQEAAQLRQEFWTSFGQYMSLHPSSEGLKINWINYKTGISGISIKTDVNNHTAFIGFVISHPDTDIREIFYEQFLQLKNILQHTTGQNWLWDKDRVDDYGKPASAIYDTLDHVNIMNKADWPDIISFFKPRLLMLDEFWNNAKYAFESLL